MERRNAVRLRVVHRRVTCPIGRNSYDDSYLKDLRTGDAFNPWFRASLGGPLSNAVTADGPEQSATETFGPFNLLYECYMRAATPGHPCHGCKHVAKWKKTIGLRTYKVEPELTHVNVLGQPHEDFPMRIVFMPLNTEGTDWYAMNIYTGQRTEVVLDAHGKIRTPEGRDPLLEYAIPDGAAVQAAIARGGTVSIPTTEPMWLGTESRDAWRCHCATCTGEEKKMLEDEEEYAEAIRQLNVNAGGVRKSAHDYPSAPIRTAMYGDKPATKEQIAAASAKAKKKPVAEPAPPLQPKKPQHASFPHASSTKYWRKDAMPPEDDADEGFTLTVTSSRKKPKTKDGDDLLTTGDVMSDAFRNMSSSTKRKPETRGPAPTKRDDTKRRTKPASEPQPQPKKTTGFNPSGRKKSK